MQIGIVGLGRMGANIARRLMRQRARMRGVRRQSRREPGARAGKARRSAGGAAGPGEAAQGPAHGLADAAGGRGDREGDRRAVGLLAAGDTIIDGGNTFWKDDIARAARLRERGIHYLDVGT